MDKKLENYLRGEFDSAVEGMRNAQIAPIERMFYMSASFTAISRVLNLEYSRRLVLTHFVLQGVHQAVVNLINQTSGGAERSIQFHPEMIDVLADLVQELGLAIVTDEPVESLLERAAEIAFSTTGNGYYLLRRGILQINETDGATRSDMP